MLGSSIVLSGRGIHISIWRVAQSIVISSTLRWRKWIARRTRSATLSEFERAGLPAGPINSIADIAADAHIASRGVKRVLDPELGENARPGCSATPFRGPSLC